MIALATSLLISAAAAVEPVLELVDGGAIDWTNMRLVVHGTGGGNTGAMNNLEAAEGDARQQLEPRVQALARAVRVDRARLAGELLDAADAVADRLEANLSAWEVFEARYHKGGSVELDAALSLQTWLRPALVSFLHAAERPPRQGGASGLVVDARELDLRCALAPEFFDAAGVHLYGIGDMTADAASQHGPVVYVADPADPIAARRAGEVPIFLRPVSVVDGTDLVFDAAAAAELRAAADVGDLLLFGNVVVVTSR